MIALYLSFIGIGVFVARGARAWITFLLLLSLLGRAVVALVLDQGLKYIFVIDSLSYEYKGWLLTQPWMSPDIFSRLISGDTGFFNHYEIFLSWVFRVFGKVAIIGMLANTILSVMVIALLSWIYRQYVSARETNPRAKITERVLVCFASVYPSYLVWSTTANRDPMYFLGCTLFLASLFTILSPRRPKGPAVPLLGLLALLFSVWLVAGIRYYALWLLLSSVGLGLLLLGLSCLIRWRVLAFALPIAGVALLYILDFTFPQLINGVLKDLSYQRLAFGNLLLLDNVAQSSFGLDTSLATVTDLLLFLPNGVAHYFFGPFLWEVNSLPELMGLVEVGCVVLLLRPTLRGVRRVYPVAPLETVIMVSFVTVFAVAQCLVISNMGTLFRHRTLPMLVLLIFASEGLKDETKDRLSTFFKT